MDELKALQIRYDLSPSLAKILLLLAKNQIVTPAMIEHDHAITKDAKVAVHRLRRRLNNEPFEIKSRRDVGYWLEDSVRKDFKDFLGSSLGGGDGAAPPSAN